jgi:hypothetical protein
MPVLQTVPAKYKPAKTLVEDWNSFRGGLNTLLAPTEIKDNDLAQAYNLMLTGKGIPTKRWGTDKYYLAGNATGSVQGLKMLKTPSINRLLSLTDDGYLTYKSNASYTTVTGFSWASGYPAEMEQLDDKMYIVQEGKNLARYDGSTLAGFATIGVPTGLGLTQVSGASGDRTYSYRVSAIGSLGETLACTAATLANQPQDLGDGTLRLIWTAVASAQGYNIYGRESGDETFLGSVDDTTTLWDDDGSADPSLFAFPPYADSTGGPDAKWIARYKDRLVYAGIASDPTLVMISGRYPSHEEFHWSVGGCYVRLDPDTGDDITGLDIHGNRIVVFKENSIWEITLSSVTIGNFTIFEPVYKLVTGSIGCISHRSIVHVENDIFFLSREGVYVLGYEPNIMADVLRTNEISAKVRPFFDGLTIAQKQNASSAYFDSKFIISFPGKEESIMYDRERLAWMGPWSFASRGWEIYYDSDNDENLVFCSTASALVGKVETTQGHDFGQAFNTVLRTKKGAFKDWTQFKLIEDVFMNLRSVSGNVDVSIRTEERDGTVRTAKDFSVTDVGGNSGWGADMFGNTLWGDSEESGSTTGSGDDVVKWANINKLARNLEVKVETDAVADDYQLLAIKSNAKPVGKGYIPTDWRV